jgi:hypothetical protein
MTIKIWSSFSCNNSSSYRLVARFADAAAAASAGDELRAFFAEHAVQMDEVMEDGDFPTESPPAAQELAKRYGLSWGTHPLTWGDEMLAGDEPAVVAMDEVLVVFHDYCGGFGEGIPGYLKARGAADVAVEDRQTPHVSLLFPYRGNAELDADLEALFAQVDDEVREVEPLKTPWKGRNAYGRAAFFNDGATVGMYFPLMPRDLPAMRAWLAERGVERSSIRICEDTDEAKFTAIAKAHCTACNARLEYWTPRLQDLDHEQLACRACGGMYELSTFLAK